MIRPRLVVVIAVTLLASTALAADPLEIEAFGDAAAIQRELAATRLPIARETKPLPEPLPAVVRITRDAIYVQGVLAGKTKPLATAGEWTAPWLEGKLSAAKGSGDQIVFAVEPEVPYRVVKKVLFNAHKIGFASVAFAVRNADSPDVVALDLRKAPQNGVGSARPLNAIFDDDGPSTPVMGSLDPALIDAVIKKNLLPIQYCYDRQLYKDTKLHGKMVVNFTIGSDGKVTRARIKSSTMASEAVESCVASRFMDLVFPKPKGGGIVNVNYPLLFSSSP